MSEGLVEVLITIPLAEAELAALQKVSPRLHFTCKPARKIDDIEDDEWKEVEVLYTERILPEPDQALNLRWIQFNYAGIDFAADAPLLQSPDVLISTLSGAAAPQVAEHAILMMLELGHHSLDISSIHAKGEWPRDRWEKLSPLELRGSTVGLVGYGSIGREIARLLVPFNVKVLAAKHNVMHPEDSDYIPPGLGDPDGIYFTRLYPFQAIRSMIRNCDFVVVATPLTPQTRGLIGAGEFKAMKNSGYLVHLGRSGVVDQTALIDALQSKQIAGAAVDVFTEEPLLQNNPLWKVPNLIITPHVAGISNHYSKRAVDLFKENLTRYLNNLPLYNRYDPERGY